MALTAGALSIVQVQMNQISVASSAASGGTGPYTEQLYMSTQSGFSPGAGNIVSGATGLGPLVVAGLLPGVTYYFVVVYTDTGAGNATVNSAQLAVATQPSQNINSFRQSEQLGDLDQRFNYNTTPVQVDVSQPVASPLQAGQAVKVVPGSLGGVPKVVACVSKSDILAGFVNYDIKSQVFLPGDRLELSQGGNVMYLWATGAIARGAQVVMDLSAIGGVKQAIGDSSTIAGSAMDGTTGPGLCRVRVSAPSFALA